MQNHPLCLFLMKHEVMLTTYKVPGVNQLNYNLFPMVNVKALTKYYAFKLLGLLNCD